MRKTTRIVLIAAPVVISIILPFLFGFPIVSKNYCPGSEKFVCPGHTINPGANWLFWGPVLVLGLGVFVYSEVLQEPSHIQRKDESG